MNFSVPEASAPSALAVCEFSAQLTFTSAANRGTTVALWDLESGAVSYHQAEDEAAPVQRCSERQHRLLLKRMCTLGPAHLAPPTVVTQAKTCCFFITSFQAI